MTASSTTFLIRWGPCHRPELTRIDRKKYSEPCSALDVEPADVLGMRMVAERQAPSTVHIYGTAGKQIAAIDCPGQWVHGTTYGFWGPADAQKFCDALEREMFANGLSYLIIDARQHANASKQDTETMWSWVAEYRRLVAMALVNSSENLALAVRMKSLSAGDKKVRPFATYEAAQAWILEVQASTPARCLRR